jgi:hypothetical protein
MSIAKLKELILIHDVKERIKALDGWLADCAVSLYATRAISDHELEFFTPGEDELLRLNREFIYREIGDLLKNSELAGMSEKAQVGYTVLKGQVIVIRPPTP